MEVGLAVGSQPKCGGLGCESLASLSFQEQEQGPSTEGLTQKAGETLSWPHSHRSQLCTHFPDDETEPQRGNDLPEGEPGLIRIPSLDSKDRALSSPPCHAQSWCLTCWELLKLPGVRQSLGDMAIWHPGQEEAGKCERDLSVEGRQDVASPAGLCPPHRTQMGCQLLRAIAVFLSKAAPAEKFPCATFLQLQACSPLVARDVAVSVSFL